jgi:hypothetical protein
LLFCYFAFGIQSRSKSPSRSLDWQRFKDVVILANFYLGRYLDERLSRKNADQDMIQCKRLEYNVNKQTGQLIYPY